MSAITEADLLPAQGPVTLFAGTPAELIEAASDVAARFSDVVRKQRLYKQISGRDHVLIEGWQTVGAMLGVFAVKDQGVRQLGWPEIAPLGELASEASAKDTERHEHHAALLRARAEGFAYGFTASFQAVRDGRVIGWGEGRCSRSEHNWVSREDFALQSMAQTRGQSRTLAGPLRWIVRLSGYASTPAEEMEDGPDAGEQMRELERLREQTRADQAAIERLTAERVSLDLAGQELVVSELESRWPDLDGVKLMTKLEKRFGGTVPEAAGVALRALAWQTGQDTGRGAQGPQTGAQSVTEAPSDPSP